MTPRSLSSQLVGLLGWLLAAFAAGAVGAAASVDAASFYAQLSKPSWAPPASFGGVFILGSDFLLLISATEEIDHAVV